MPAADPMARKQLSAARLGKRQDVLEVRRRGGERPDRRGRERPVANRERGEDGSTASDLERARSDVHMRNPVAERVEHRSDRHGGAARPAGSAGRRPGRDVERDDHRDSVQQMRLVVRARSATGECSRSASTPARRRRITPATVPASHRHPADVSDEKLQRELEEAGRGRPDDRPPRGHASSVNPGGRRSRSTGSDARRRTILRPAGPALAARTPGLPLSPSAPGSYASCGDSRRRRSWRQRNSLSI